MTELDLFRWVKEWEPEYRWDINGVTRRDDVIIWVSIYSLSSFLAIVPYSLLDDGGIEVRLQDKTIAIWASDICDPLDIVVANIFPKE